MRKLSLHVRRNAVGYVALFFALAGGAYATTIAAPNSVNSQAIINGQVKPPDLATGAVTASKVAPNSLTGGQIKESSLGQVPKAGQAANASDLGGAPASAFSRPITFNDQGLGSTPTTVLASHGLTLKAKCDEFPTPSSLTVTASSSSSARFEVNDIQTRSNANPTPMEADYILNPGDPAATVVSYVFPNTNSGDADAGGTFVYTPASGQGAVTGTFHYYIQNGGGECDLLGNAVPSP